MLSFLQTSGRFNQNLSIIGIFLLGFSFHHSVNAETRVTVKPVEAAEPKTSWYLFSNGNAYFDSVVEVPVSDDRVPLSVPNGTIVETMTVEQMEGNIGSPISWNRIGVDYEQSDRLYENYPVQDRTNNDQWIATVQTADRKFQGILANSSATTVRLWFNGQMTSIDKKYILSWKIESGEIEALPISKTDVITLRLRGFVQGITWKPLYRILLNNQTTKFERSVQIQNQTMNTIKIDDRLFLISSPDQSVSDDNKVGQTNPNHKDSSYFISQTNAEAIDFPKQDIQPNATATFLAPLEYSPKVEKLYRCTIEESIDRLQNPMFGTLCLQMDSPKDRSLAPGTMMVLENGTLLGKSNIPYTVKGSPLIVSFGQESSIKVQINEVELNRKQKTQFEENVDYNWVQVTGSMQVTSTLLDPVRVQISRIVEGAGTKAIDASIMTLPNRLGKKASLTQMQWDFTIESSKDKRISYAYELFNPIFIEQ